MTRFWLTFSALAAAALSSCSKPPPPGAISAGDVGYALNVLAHAPEQGFAPNAFGEQALARLDPNVDRARRDQLLHAAVVAYANAEHGFVHDPSRPAHRANDAADAWRRVLAFL